MEMNGVAVLGQEGCGLVTLGAGGRGLHVYAQPVVSGRSGEEWGGVETNVRPLETRLSTDEAPAGKTGPCQSGRGADWPGWKLSRRG